MAKKPAREVFTISQDKITVYATDEEALAAVMATGKPIVNATKPVKLIVKKTTKAKKTK